MVFDTTFNNMNISLISCRSVLLLEETGENHRPAAIHWQTLSHNVVSSTPRLIGFRIHNFNGDRYWLHQSLPQSYMSLYSCNNVAPVTNLCLGGATTRSHSSQWSKNKFQLKHKNSLFTLQTFHYNYYWWSQSLLNRFGWKIYAFQR